MFATIVIQIQRVEIEIEIPKQREDTIPHPIIFYKNIAMTSHAFFIK